MIFVLSTTTTPAQDEDSPYGTYEYVSGKNADGAIPRDRLKGTVKVTEDMVLLLGEDGQEQFAISFQAQEAEGDEPVKVTLKIERSALEDAVGGTARALAKHEGDTVTLIYDFSEGGAFPDDFEPDGQQHLFVLKKTADAAK